MTLDILEKTIRVRGSVDSQNSAFLEGILVATIFKVRFT